MMLGVVAQQPEPHTWTSGGRMSGGGLLATQSSLVNPPVLPDAIGTFDFVNNTYDWNGSTLAVADVTDQSAWRTANGLEVPATGTSASLTYNDTKTFLAACSFTIVFEVEILNVVKINHLLVVSTAGESIWIELQSIPFGTVEWYANERDGFSNDKFCDHYQAIPIGIHRVALTRTDSYLSISADGNATSATSDPPNSLPETGDPMAHFYIGTGPFWGTNDGAIRIRSIDFYDAQTDNNVLPLLSAP